MKKKFILLPLVGVLFYLIFSSNAVGPNFVAIPPVGAGCNCHTTSSLTTINMQLLSNPGLTPVTAYAPGNSYFVRITGTNTDAISLPKFGYQVGVLNSGLTSAGSLTLPDIQSHFVSGGGVTAIEHSSPQDRTTGTGGTGSTYVRTIAWTPPGTPGTGTITLAGCVNAVNGDGFLNTERWNSGTASIQELAQITGTAQVCVTGTTSLTDATGGGTWSSSTPVVGTVNASGVVTGLAAGTTVVSYHFGGTYVTKTVTVNANPGSFGGTPTVCMTHTTTITNSVGGGIWSNGGSSVASIASGTGVVTGINAGTALMTYAVGSCSATTTVTVNSLLANTGTASVCVGSTTTLSNPNGGGTWSSSTPAVGTVNSSGVVQGLAAGTTNISYTLSPSGCAAVTTVTVNASPAPINPIPQVCISGTVTATNSVSGGTWSTSAGTGSISIGASTGIVTGATAGTANVTYTMPGGCSTTAVATINALPSAISGATTFCANATTTLSSTPTGGTWTSNNTSIALVDPSTGVVSGASPAGGGTAISYTLSTGCLRTSFVNVQPISPVSGTMAVCRNASTTLSSAPAGGTWTSGATGVATVVPTTGVVTGVTAGTAPITYTVSTGCRSSAIVTVNENAAITGGGNVCTGSTLSMTNAVAGGTWSSSNTAVGTINTSGVFSGLSSGTSTVAYTTPAGCVSSTVVTVNAGAGSVTGSGGGVFCGSATINASGGSGGTIYYQGTTSGGTSTIAPSTSQVVTASGTYYFRVQSSAGCWGAEAAINVTVNPNPSSISGIAAVCVGSTANLSSTPTGGTWSSSTPAVGTVNTTGVFTAVGSGTATIQYATTEGCTTSGIITVNVAPGAVAGSGSGTFCASTVISASGGAGGTIYFQGTTSGGTSAALASTSQTVTSTGTYYFRVRSSAGCWGPEAAISVTINPIPSAISGTALVCAGATTALASTPAGGTWASGDISKGTIDASSGIFTGLAAGTSTVTYTASGCAATKVITVQVAPAAVAVSGGGAFCGNTVITASGGTGGTIFFQGTTPGGTSVGSPGTSQTVTASGTYYFRARSASGCWGPEGSATVTINPLPAAITGPAAICDGGTGTLANTTPGGTWVSSNIAVATINSATGLATGVTIGTTTITYVITATGCFVTRVLTVTPLPGAVSGGPEVCVQSAINLSVSPSGGIWSSGNTAVATVGSLSGSVTGAGAGTATITYTLGTGCSSFATITVNPLPAVIAGGNTAICVNENVVLTNSTGGGIWGSGNPGVASVNTSGVVTGVAAGNALISYTLSTGCSRTTNISVNPVPSAIGGSLTPCVGASSTLNGTPAGGTWSSNNTSVATIDATSAVVSALVAGTALISYILPTGCARSATVIVSPLPSSITGTPTTCVGVTTTLNSTPGGGTWTSGNTAIATVTPSSGIVTGVGIGTANISYAVSSGCSVSRVVTINAAPTAGTITGSASVCTGLSIPLTSTVPGGTWSSSNNAIATVDASGNVSGVAAGSVAILYTVMTPCGTVVSTKNISVTISAVSGTITGPDEVCIGSNITLSSSVLGGVWSSSTASVAGVGSSSGVVTAFAVGTATVSYTISSSCGVATATAVVSVNPLPSAIMGATSVCVNATTMLSNTGGGTWSSNDESIADADEVTGDIMGIAAGTAIITYTLPTGCRISRVLTVLPLPEAIAGPLTLCAGSTATLSNATAGGTWNSSNTSIATIGSLSGFVTTLTAGSTLIKYTAPITGCVRSAVMNVNPSPLSITGTTSVCVGASSTLSNATPAGTWSSNNVAIMGIDPASGLINGVNAGTTIITYQLSTGCRRTATVTVNALPGSIAGIPNVCPGATTTLTNSMAGGTWASGDVLIATISASGVVTGVVPGNADITYTSGAGCHRTTNVTVFTPPATITGAYTTCVGTTSALSNSVGGGAWSSSNASVASITGSGVYTGNVSGTSTVAYTLPTGCSTNVVVTINALPSPISGTPAICLGDTRTFSSMPVGGTWASSLPTVANVELSTGVVTSVAVGSSILTYELATGCKRTLAINVNPLPTAISGTLNVCAGSSTLLSSTSIGGSWSSSIPGIASVGSASGMVSGVSVGTALISYSFPTGCRTTAIATVNALPAIITGAASVCVGATTTLASAPGGGTWASNNPSIGTIAAATGEVVGIAPGASLITYTLPTGCIRTMAITVNPLPDAGTITGATSVCVAGTTTLLATVPGGFWGITTGKAMINTVGIVTGISAGADTIKYNVTNVCGTDVVMYPVTVNPLPFAGVITGSSDVCIGGALPLVATGTGGGWSSSNTGVATVSGFGVVLPVTVGTSIISYTATTACGTAAATKEITVHPLADAGIIKGRNTVCAGDTLMLEGTVAGGTWGSSNTTVAVVNSEGVVTGLNPGIASIRYTVTNACSMDTIAKLVTVQALTECETSVPDVTNTAMRLFPNPTNGLLTIETLEPGELSIGTIDGREVYRSNLKPGSTTIKLPVGIAGGVYMCRFSGDSGHTAIVKVVYTP